MRSLAALVDDVAPDILALCEIDAGDAFALATRFARDWAYRGGQALLWNRVFTASAVRDAYLPFAVARPFDRRGLLRVDGALAGMAVTLFTTQFSRERSVATPELRFARSQIGAVSTGATVAFAQFERTRVGLEGRGVVAAAHDASSGMYVYSRGFGATFASRREGGDGIGRSLVVEITARS